jgi:hypothetical protein
LHLAVFHNKKRGVDWISAADDGAMMRASSRNRIRFF